MGEPFGVSRIGKAGEMEGVLLCGCRDHGVHLTREREAASFLRQLNLGQGIDTERIAANYSNGVLNVTIPVSEKAKPRKISVESAEGQRGIESRESDASSSETVQPVES